jgi:hypothetical protein
VRVAAAGNVNARSDGGVGGIKVPFKITINQGGRRFSDVVVKDYKINTGLVPLELARRPQ